MKRVDRWHFEYDDFHLQTKTTLAVLSMLVGTVRQRSKVFLDSSSPTSASFIWREASFSLALHEATPSIAGTYYESTFWQS